MVRYSVLKARYELEKTIGCGGFAKVKLATHLLTGEKVAIKIMNKSCLGDDVPRVRKELEAMKTLSHHHICKLYEIIETDTHIFMVVEYCSGGELFDHIVERNRLIESEARSFFRQIISAVAYLHGQGYAHRDLKPENILLDKEQNLKLIDFGLCTKPKGGLESQLLTSCGSPTYAAPELIQGKQYLGSEVDIWSMGVLLYALLCGFLPFDDDSIERLYRKILSGSYVEPEWLTRESKTLIKSMLQLDPKKRITIKELQCHPWVIAEYGAPVCEESRVQFHEMDRTCVGVMAQHFGVTRDEMWNTLNQWSYDYNTSTYLLLLAKKKRRAPVRLARAIYRTRAYENVNQKLDDSPRKCERIVDSGLKSTYIVMSHPNPTGDGIAGKEAGYNSANKTGSSTNEAVENHSCFTEPSLPTPQRRAHKRYWSPGLDENTSPVPRKKTPGSGRSHQTPSNCSSIRNSDISPSATTSSTPCATTPQCARKVLGSIERSLQRVRKVLTPRRRPSDNAEASGPALLSTKNLVNVSTIACNEPERVREELFRMLTDRGFECRQKGWVVRAKQARLSFELEVCLVAPSPGADAVVAVRRHRLKGDAWSYKRVCEQVLALHLA